MSRSLGVISRGVRLPIIKSGEDNLKNIILESLENAQKESGQEFRNKDIICITESIVARAENNYVSVDDIANDITEKYGENAEIIVLWPIYSRNRFSMILKGIARSASKIYLILDDDKDEVGNDKINPFTGIDIEEFYKEIITNENCECSIEKSLLDVYEYCTNVLYSRCHMSDEEINYVETVYLYAKSEHQLNPFTIYTLDDICSSHSSKHGYNIQYGVLGSNKATEESLKLFPTLDTCEKLCNSIQDYFSNTYNINVEVMVYGDGCFKDPVGEIWEFADPVVSPYCTAGLIGTPNEIKIKYIADNESSDDDYIKKSIKNKAKNLKGHMSSQGTTPRRYCDLVGSLADLTSGSGDKGTPVVWISGYFDSYNEE